ncbi:MAG: IS66 family transposase [Acetobacteraceae bacterium]
MPSTSKSRSNFLEFLRAGHSDYVINEAGARLHAGARLGRPGHQPPRRRTDFATLDHLLQRLHANKSELLLVLDRPEIPLNTNGSENDIRCQVTKRHVSGGTKSNTGRDRRDAFLGLAKTCRKLGIAFWDYLGAGLAVPACPNVPYLPDLVRCRGHHA